VRKPIIRKSALTVRDVAQRLQLPERSVRYRLQKNELRGERGPEGWRIAKQDLEAFLQKVANVEPAAWHQRLKKSRTR